MPAPVAEDILWRPGTDGTPANDDDPIIGAIDTGSEFDPDDADQVIASGEADVIAGSARTHYGGGYIKLEEGGGGSLQSVYLWLANGGLVMPSAGSLTITDPTGANDGLVLTACGLVDGEPVVEVLDELDGVVATTTIFDAGSKWWLQADGAIAGVNGTDDLIVTVGATQVALMRAPHVTKWPTGLNTVGSIFRLAVTNNASVALAAADRTTLPTATGGLTSFSSGALVAGSDGRQSLGSIADAAYRGFVLEKVIPPGMRAPTGGMPHKFVLSALASA